tara:strand:+ start:456 stop:695 length:240 start_codon:yes stop_codon:yes gene_type:complete
MTLDEFKKKVKEIEAKTDFIVSWKALKYNKTIFRTGNMNESGCRTWEKDGKKYMTFYDASIDRYTTAIDPMIHFKKARN